MRHVRSAASQPTAAPIEFRRRRRQRRRRFGAVVQQQQQQRLEASTFCVLCPLCVRACVCVPRFGSVNLVDVGPGIPPERFRYETSKPLLIHQSLIQSNFNPFLVSFQHPRTIAKTNDSAHAPLTRSIPSIPHSRARSRRDATKRSPPPPPPPPTNCGAASIGASTAPAPTSAAAPPAPASPGPTSSPAARCSPCCTIARCWRTSSSCCSASWPPCGCPASWRRCA